jgi:uncharacterized protein
MMSLSERAEFLIVALVALGPLIASTTIDAVTHTASLSEPRLRMLLAFELPVGAALIAFLRVRGWTASSLGAPRPTLKDVLVGLGLAVVLTLSYAILFVIMGSLRPGTQWISIEDLQSAGQPGLRAILAVSIINPVFEELFVNAYLLMSLTKQGKNLATAIAVSIAIRFLYRYSLGVLVTSILIIPMGLIFGCYFGRHQRLWPVVVAHGLTDFYSLGGGRYVALALTHLFPAVGAS